MREGLDRLSGIHLICSPLVCTHLTYVDTEARQTGLPEVSQAASGGTEIRSQEV